jgi:hypothetical protein
VLGDVPAQEQTPSPAPRSKARSYAVVAAILLIGVVACILMWSFSAQPALPQWLHGSNELNLSATARDHSVRISWNHAARELSDAIGATLVVTDGSNRHEIKLGLDELRLGAVEYERTSPRIQVKMTINTPGATSPAESIQWPPE